MIISLITVLVVCRREITVRGMFLTSTMQHSSQQARSAALAVSNEPVSLDDVDTVLSNLEGLCSEEQSWATQDAGLEQCIQVHAPCAMLLMQSTAITAERCCLLQTCLSSLAARL